MGPQSWRRTWITPDDCRLDAFKESVERPTDPESVPLADEIIERIPIYAGVKVRQAAGDPAAARDLMAEWNNILADGPGIIAFKNAYPDHSVLDQVKTILVGILDEEEADRSSGGDHFAPAGANSRLWNAHEKLCMASPELFVRYNSCPVVDLVSKSWLGPRYQITAQVNVVRPGAPAQTCHRDYHMGFQTAEDLAGYPATAHAVSAALTLQGAVAHMDIPIESGPTKLLPYSQTYLPGYVATLLPDFRAYFEEHYVQLPLKKGDALFFNPAVFHAAGENTSTDIHRFANLMQIGSGYGRSTELVDRTRMCLAIYPLLADMKKTGQIDAVGVDCVINACAEGYAFPVNLDLDSPLGGMAPPSQQEILREALNEDWSVERFAEEITAQADRKRTH